jgi:hypothetical protein
MKKFIFFVVLTVLLSCESDQQITNSEANVSFSNERLAGEDIYYDIIENEDVFLQKQIASSYSAEEILRIWQIKLNVFKRENLLNSDQILLIDELLSELTSAHFTEGAVRDDFYNGRNDYYLSSAIDLFGENEGWYLLTHVENINHRVAHFQRLGFTLVDTIEPCNCSKDSHCRRINGVSLGGISWETGRCGGVTCYRPVYLFGLIESDNNARCSY